MPCRRTTVMRDPPPPHRDSLLFMPVRRTTVARQLSERVHGIKISPLLLNFPNAQKTWKNSFLSEEIIPDGGGTKESM